MKFSIIVPVYKVEEYLPECVDSLLKQSYDDFEVILVDDGSPDGCPQLCDAYAQKDRRIKVVHKENGGLSDARNAGISAATGDYLLFVDSDDFWNTDQVLCSIADILKEKPVTVVQFGHQKFYQAENRYEQVAPRTLSRYNGQPTEQVLKNLISGGSLMISAWSMAIDAGFLKENQLYFKKGIKTEDLEWAVRLYSYAPTWAFSDEYFYIYRMQRAGSITSTIDFNHLCDYCWIIEDGVERLEKDLQPIQQVMMSYMMYHVLIACALCYRTKLEKKQRKELLGRLKKIAKGRICRYKLDKKVKLASTVYRVGGFGIMAKVLGFYLNHRGR